VGAGFPRGRISLPRARGAGLLPAIAEFFFCSEVRLFVLSVVGSPRGSRRGTRGQGPPKVLFVRGTHVLPVPPLHPPPSTYRASLGNPLFKYR
jgi:hypothetical protein